MKGIVIIWLVNNFIFINICVRKITKALEISDLNELLKVALMDNKPEFVILLLENGANYRNFLTKTNLFELYNYQSVNSKN